MHVHGKWRHRGGGDQFPPVQGRERRAGGWEAWAGEADREEYCELPGGGKQHGSLGDGV